jgi:hypothetical protein
MDLANVPELRRQSDEEPGDLREDMAGLVRAALKRKGFGSYRFEVSGHLVPEQTLGIVGGWLLILSRKTGLLGDNANIAAAITIPTGLPTADQVGKAVDAAKEQLDVLHRSLMPGLNGSGTSGT